MADINNIVFCASSASAAQRPSGAVIYTNANRPPISHKVTYTKARANDSEVTYTVKIASNILSSGGYIGSGLVLTGKVTVGGVSSTQTIKASSGTWSTGTTKNTTYTIKVTGKLDAAVQAITVAVTGTNVSAGTFSTDTREIG